MRWVFRSECKGAFVITTCPSSNNFKIESHSASLLTFGIIGYGQFGAFIHKLLQTHFPENIVNIHSYEMDVDGGIFQSLDEVANSDVIFLAVPIKDYEPVVKALLPLVQVDTVLVDVATVKVHTSKLFDSLNLPCRFISTHPMFGPESYKKVGGHLDGFRIVVTEHNLEATDYSATKHILAKAGIRVIETSADQHDRDLAETLFLTHYVGQVVANAGFLRTEIDTVSFGFLMDAVDAVKNDGDLFDQVIRFNPYCAKVIDRFDQSDREVRQKMLEHSPANHSKGMWYSY